jgi:glycosyltransferase involved in cell wall biosynthesis
MRVSVVICEHTMERYEDVREAADSVRSQSYDDVELVLVSDGNEKVCERFREEYGTMEDVVIHCNEENVGLLESRNNGAKAATGNVVAFLDDDAVADPDWVAQLVESYEQRDVPAVGGKMVPEWVAGKPEFLPEEFYWLIGVTHRGFGPEGDPDASGEVRNTFGSNISFKMDVFKELDGFNPAVGGRKGDANLQAEEPELGVRLRQEYGHGVWYNPQAEVAHKVFEYRTDPKWLLDRAFWQGYSKRAMETMIPESSGQESEFLRRLVTEYAPSRARELVRKPSIAKFLQFAMLFVFTIVVGFGYLYGMWTWKDDTLFL